MAQEKTIWVVESRHLHGYWEALAVPTTRPFTRLRAGSLKKNVAKNFKRWKARFRVWPYDARKEISTTRTRRSSAAIDNPGANQIRGWIGSVRISWKRHVRHLGHDEEVLALKEVEQYLTVKLREFGEETDGSVDC